MPDFLPTVHLDWGASKAAQAAVRGDIVVVEDVLSFSSALVTAVHFGATVYPHSGGEDAKRLAAKVGAGVTVSRSEAAKLGGRSLSPLSLRPEDDGKPYVLCSPNGATCCTQAANAPAVIVGSLLNARAAAWTALMLQERTHRHVCVIACGERRGGTEETRISLRPCLEDYLGAGAVLSHFRRPLSANSFVCRSGFLAVRNRLPDLLLESRSGAELVNRGFEEDVKFCARVDAFDTAPILKDGRFAPDGE